jgi:hypothetical protein
MAESNVNEIRGPSGVPNFPVGESNRVVEAGGLTIRTGVVVSDGIVTANSPRVLPVRFGKRFASTPTVQLSLAGFDVNGSSNRVGFYVSEAHEESCVIHVYTWDDTKIHRIWLNWMAVGT